MTAQAPETATPAATRPALLDQRLARATAGMCRDHPALAHTVRGVLAPLRDRLRRVHLDCLQAEAAAWAGYTADLDRGLGELSVEVARAAQRPGSTRDVEDVLSMAAARLELQAWQLRLDAPETGASGTEQARLLADVVARDLAALEGESDAPSAAALRARLDQDLAALRRLSGGPRRT